MKPLKLKIQAFGPFADTQWVDFQQLGDNPLFLINGNTGSGKSTLLDAISFALYGETTGKEREASQMRCDYSPSDLTTEVLLDFQLSGQTYRVQRSPKQDIKKSRGDGLTSKQPEASLWQLMDDGSETLLASRKVTEVNDKIKTLMGLTGEQFRQVMVLPQGKFRELLLADSKDRELIFSQLFQTQIYKKVEDAIKNQAKSVSDQMAEHKIRLATILDSVGLTDESELEGAINNLKPIYKELKGCKDLAATAVKKCHTKQEAENSLNSRFESLKKQQSQLESHQAQQPNIDENQLKLTQAIKADQLKPTFDNVESLEIEQGGMSTLLEQVSQALKQAKEELLEAESRLKTAKKDADTLDSLKYEKQALLIHQADLDKLTKAEVELKSAESNAELAANKLLELQEKRQAYQQQIVESEDQQNALQKKLLLESDLQADANQLSNVLKDYHQFNQLQQQLTKSEEQGQKASELLELREEEAKQANSQATTLEMNWHLGQAAVLAESLSPDSACPVCGSLDHPQLAQWQDSIEAVTKKQLEASKISAQVAAKSLADADLSLVDCRAEWRGLNKQIEPLKLVLVDWLTFELPVLEAQFDGLKKQLEAIAANKQALGKLNAVLVETKMQLKALEEQFELLHKESSEKQNQFSLCQQTYQSLLQNLPETYRTPSALTKALAEIELKIKSVTQALEKAMTDETQVRSQSDKAGQRHTEITKQLADITQKYDKAEQQWQTLLIASEFESLESFQQALLTTEIQAAYQGEIKTYQDQASELTGAIKLLSTELESETLPDLAKIQAELEQKQLLMNEAEEGFEKINYQVKQLNDVQEKLAQESLINLALEEEYKVIGTLSAVLSGSEGDKVSLQRFVLSVLLDDVLLQASERLKIMSKGRYELIRKEERAKGNKASGLELEVADSYTGKNRSVATLSGGESFMAALALALGLSDVVQAYSGGIKLDTLFIDEGFGSLDPESLDLAIDTLKQLQSNGRTIGIISHVTELKEQMALRVDVTASAFGSSIKLKTV